MNNIDVRYQELLKDILENGTQKGDRTGTGTISVFGRQIRHKMSEGFPLLTTKKMYFKGIVTELLWFLRGDTNIKYLVDNNCHIWDGDAIKNYEKHNGLIDWGPFITKEEAFIDMIKTDNEFANKWGELGPVYGKQWRNWCGYEKVPAGWEHGAITYYKNVAKCDQIETLIRDLKTNPDSRRLMVNAWNVGELDQMVLPPCHYGFQVYTRELSLDERMDLMVKKHKMILEGGDDSLPTRAISLMWNQRSVDTFLGLPFNIASYGLLLEIIAKVVNMVPDELIGNLGDVHLYSNHIEQAKEQIGRELRVDERVCMCYENPKLDLTRLQEGMSDDEFTKVCDEFGIPTRTREPFELPKLIHEKTDDFYKSLGDDLSLINHLDNTDFKIENYQSHATIKAPLSN
jgi:thymidylate synthase